MYKKINFSRINKEVCDLLKYSSRRSSRLSVGASVINSVLRSVRDSVKNSLDVPVWETVGIPVRNSIKEDKYLDA